MRRGVWDADMSGALVADEISLGKTFTLVATAMISKLLTEKGVMGLPLLILWGNTLAEWVNIVQNDFPCIVGEEREWYPLQRLNSVPHCMLEIQKTLPLRHQALITAHEPILVVTMHGVAETFKTVIDVMTHGTDSKLVNLLRAANANFTDEDLNTRIAEPEN
jgi:hypothetical protein